MLRSCCCPCSLALAVAGCGGGDGTPAWDGPDSAVRGRRHGLVDDFNAYADEVDEPWERSPALLAGEFLRLDRAQASRTSLDAEAPGEGTIRRP